MNNLRALIVGVTLLAAPTAIMAQGHPTPKQAATKAAAQASAHATAEPSSQTPAPTASHAPVQPAAQTGSHAPKQTVSAEAAGTVAPAAAPAPAAASPSANKAAIPTSITIARETFDYNRTGRRDPYKSLMTSSDIRPLLSDLKLVSVAYDSTGAHSVALLRDVNTKERYMLKVGQQLGRLRVANIKYKSVVFTIEEFGFNRQETLHMGSDTTKARTP